MKRKEGSLAFLPGPPANSQQTLSEPGLEPEEPFLLGRRCQCLVGAKGALGLFGEGGSAVPAS